MYCELVQPLNELRVIPKILLRCGRLKAPLKHTVIYIMNACNIILVTSTLLACGLLTPGQYFENIFEWMNASERKRYNQICTRILISYSK
jgi:hypothetical protein